MRNMIIKLEGLVIGEMELTPVEVRDYQNAGFTCIPV